jgi:chaperonin cofactor prefoldin
MVLSVNKALEEISAIERIVKPYEYQVYEAKRVLNDLAALREHLNEMSQESIRTALEILSKIESQAALYRGYGPVEAALKHGKRLEEELKKILETL